MPTISWITGTPIVAMMRVQTSLIPKSGLIAVISYHVAVLTGNRRSDPTNTSIKWSRR